MQPGAPRIPGIGSVSLKYSFFKDHLLRDYLGGSRLKVLAAKNDRGELALYRLEDEPFWARRSKSWPVYTESRNGISGSGLL